MNRPVPDFADPTPDDLPAAPAPAPSIPAPPRPVWPRRIVGAIVVIAILAIAAAVLLPRQRQSVAPVSIQPSQTPTTNPTPDAAAPMPPPQPTPNTPNPQPQGGQTAAAPSSTLTPNPTPNAPQQQALGPQALMTPQQAQAVAEQMDATEKGQIAEGLRYMARYLRDEKFQDPDFWPIMQTAMATQGLSMIGGGATMGTAQVMGLIANAGSGNEAADNLERYSYNLPSALPQAVKQQIAQALASATTADQAYQGVQGALAGSNIQLSQATNSYLSQVIQQATQAGAGGVPVPK